MCRCYSYPFFSVADVPQDVILHVRDLSHPDRLIHHTTVMQALAAINVSPSTPIITVDNKADLVDHSMLVRRVSCGYSP